MSVYVLICECGKEVRGGEDLNICPHCRRLLELDVKHRTGGYEPPKWAKSAARAVQESVSDPQDKQ